jgi:hypothetical protein
MAQGIGRKVSRKNYTPEYRSQKQFLKIKKMKHEKDQVCWRCEKESVS